MTPKRRLVEHFSGALECLVLAAMAYVPLLLTKPGVVAADTKQYLYLDPGRLMSQALSMWDPSIAGGTVTHQKIGYLLPQGPFYWAFAHLGVATWVTQRLWMGTLLFAAGTGVRYLARVVDVAAPGALVGGLAYELSPYLLQYIQRISAILMPWAGLGWMVAFAILAVRRGGWRYPARFALVIALAGGTNATSLLYVGLAPAIYLVYSVVVAHEATARRAIAAALRIGVLSLATSLWWISGLQVEGTYGINVLKYTETLPAIAGTSLASEVLRGLGYWYFYGSDRLGPWLQAAVKLQERAWSIATSFAVPTLAILAAVLLRWRLKAYFALLVLVGMVLAVGMHPYYGPSIAGTGLKNFMTASTAGLALRSSDRATPLVVLGLAVLLGAGTGALRERLRGTGWAVATVVVGLVVANSAPLLEGGAVASGFARPSSLPAYDARAASSLDAQGSSTRVLIEPGEDFASYSWGNTVDSIWPGLMTRPEIMREQLVQGSSATVDLLEAFDLTLQQGTYEPSTLAPIARLFSAGDVLLQSDLAFWHYNTPRPQATWAQFDPPPPGIGAPIKFGKPVPNIAPPGDRLIDEEALTVPSEAAWPPPVAVFPVSSPRPIYRAEPASAPLVVDGSGAGVVAAAAAGLLANNPTIVYAGTIPDTSGAGASALRKAILTRGAQLLVTDSNRKALDRWTSMQGDVGATLPAVAVPSAFDPTAQALPVFVHERPSGQSVAAYSDAVYVASSTYGNPVAFTPEDRPAMAFDGNISTAWSVAAFSPASGNWIEVRLKHPVTTDHLNLVQDLTGTPNRWITRATLTFDGTRHLEVDLGASSRTSSGQTVSFPRTSFTTLRVTIDGTTWANRTSLGGATGVGFSEIRVPGVNVAESIVLPSDLLRALGSSSISHRLTILMSRDRVGPYPPRTDPELFLDRQFWLPTARSFSVGGTARISALIPDNVIDTLLGGSQVFGGAVVGSNRRLPGDLNARAVSAFDGNPATWWSPGFDYKAQIGAWVQAALPRPVSFDHLALKVVADGRHSVPTAIRITSNDGSDVLVRLPAIADRSGIGSVVSVPVSFPEVTGSVIRFTVESIRAVNTINWYSEAPITMPVGIAEIGVPGVRIQPESPSASIPVVCRGDLLRIDGKPVWLAISGKVGPAENLEGLTVRGCGPDAHGLRLGPGDHHLTATWGDTTGWNLDRLVLDSAPGGAALPSEPNGSAVPAPGTLAGGGVPALGAPTVKVLAATATSARLRVTGVTSPFWLVLGESINSGWQASLSSGQQLGAPVLVDGYANGWYVTPKPGESALSVTLDYRPETTVRIALSVSAVALLGTVGLGFAPIGALGRRRRRAHAPKSPGTGVSTNPARRSSPEIALAPAGRKLGPVAAVTTGVLLGAVALLVLPPVVAVGAGVATAVVAALAARWPRARLCFALVAVGGSASAGILTVVGQATRHYPPGDSWPTNFETAGVLAFVAVVALVAEAALAALATSGGSDQRELGGSGGSPTSSGPVAAGPPTSEGAPTRPGG